MKRHAVLASVAVAGIGSTAEAPRSTGVDNDWFRGWPPAEVTYSFPSPIRQGNTRLGNIDTLAVHVGYIEDVRLTENFELLAGFDWRRFQASVPDNSPVPNTLQSVAAVLSVDARLGEKFRLRLEVLPGIYSDFRELTARDFNAPLTAELSYTVNPTLLIGAQLNADARREAVLLGGAGVRWRFADAWLLSLWLPRPQIEFSATEQITLFAGASFAGGTYVVSDNFGLRAGRAELSSQAVDYQEIRAGGGLRWRWRQRVAAEVAGGWTIDRRYHFHERNVLLNGDGAPYVQFSMGLAF